MRLKLDWNKLHEIQAKENRIFTDKNMAEINMKFSSDLLPGNFLITKRDNKYEICQLTTDYREVCYIDGEGNIKTLKEAKERVKKLIPRTDEQLLQQRREEEERYQRLIKSLDAMLEKAGLMDEWKAEAEKNGWEV